MDMKAKTHALAHLATGLQLRWHAGRRSHSGPQHRLRERRIPHWNIIVVDEGEFLVRMGDATQRTLTRGQGVLIAPGLKHDIGMQTTGVIRWADFDLLAWNAVPLAHFLCLQQWLTPEVCAVIGDLIITLNQINARRFNEGLTDLRRFFNCQGQFIDLLLKDAAFTTNAPNRLAAMLRIADSIDRSESQRIPLIEGAVANNRFIISVPEIDDLSLEQLALQQKGTLFEDVFGMPIELRRAKA